ncbi:MAG TPA: LUD domain-containing protein [Flavipsychrobacter sp.]|nr:LUD domain-containing protein [Flavipsychrobacter sp.]
MQILKSSKTREKILAKIRGAVAVAPLRMPFPEAEREQTKLIFKESEFSDEESFASAFIKLGGKFVYCYNETDLAENLFALYENNNWKEILCADAAILELLNKHELPRIAAMDKGSKEAEVCITACEAVVGRTGSIIFSSRQFMGRTAPVYYPIHIIIAYSNQTVADIDAGIALMRQKYGSDLPSMINFTTGPSRTADIEKTLVVGVHGPAELYCFYVDA